MTEDGPAPPALGVKVNVASTPALPATRSALNILNVIKVTAKPMGPHDTAGLDGVGSALVCTVTESEAALATPMVQPTSVTVTAVSADSKVPAAAKTMEAPPGCAGVRVVFCVDTLAVGVGEVAKKPDG